MHEHLWTELVVMEQGEELVVGTFCTTCDLSAADLIDWSPGTLAVRDVLSFSTPDSTPPAPSASVDPYAEHIPWDDRPVPSGGFLNPLDRLCECE